MRYLYSSLKGNKIPEESANEGEPVIPAFPVADNINRFIGCDSFKPCFYAEAKSVPLIADDLDALHARVCKEYPGLPSTLIENYILAVVRVCKKLDEGALVHCFITYNEAKLKLADDDKVLMLWDKQPL